MTQPILLLALLVLLLGSAGRLLIRLRRHMIHGEPNRIEIVRHDVWFPDLPPSLDGAVVCQISDLHITPAPRNEDAIAAALRSVEADLYVFTGDMIFYQDGIVAFFRWLDSLGDCIRPAVAVLGNAEHKKRVNTDEVLSGCAARGIPVLNNACLRRPVRGGWMQIVGVDDPHTQHADFSRAYAEADPNAWTLLLCHSPDGVADLNGHRADLMLCGHTHGGQVRLPLVPTRWANTLRVKGLLAGWYGTDSLQRWVPQAAGRTQLYVSRGLGTSGIRARLLCPPELPVFTMRRTRA